MQRAKNEKDLAEGILGRSAVVIDVDIIVSD